MLIIFYASIIVFTFIFIFLIKNNGAKIKGSFGEHKVHKTLVSLGSEYVSLHDMLIRNANGATSQIDHLVLSEYGIFVIETKYYKGWIFGNEKSENWMQVIFKEKYPFRNPIKQNWSHIYTLKNILADFPQTAYYSIVVFAGNATLKDIKSSVPVIYWNELNGTIKAASTKKCLSSDDVLRIKKLLESKAVTEKGAQQQHIRAIQQDITERRLKTENLICPRCNGELKLRNSRNGKFYGCENYPRCRFTMPY